MIDEVDEVGELMTLEDPGGRFHEVRTRFVYIYFCGRTTRLRETASRKETERQSQMGDRLTLQDVVGQKRCKRLPRGVVEGG